MRGEEATSWTEAEELGQKGRAAAEAIPTLSSEFYRPSVVWVSA